MLTGVSLLPSDSRSTVAWRMDWILGLQGRLAKKMSIACCRVKPLHQYMYASAVAGALPNPAMHPTDQQREVARRWEVVSMTFQGRRGRKLANAASKTSSYISDCISSCIRMLTLDME